MDRETKSSCSGQKNLPGTSETSISPRINAESDAFYIPWPCSLEELKTEELVHFWYQLIQV